MSPAPARLGTARALATRFRTETCEVVRAGAVASTVGCAVMPADVQAYEDVVGGRIGNESLWRIRLPAGTDVAATDQIRQTSVSPSRLFEVLRPGGPRSYEAERVALCRELL